MFGEITVQIMFSRQQTIAVLRMEGFRLVNKKLMHDMYYTHLPHDQKHSYRDLIANSVLLRRISDAKNKVIYKHKFFDANGNVFSEERTDCIVDCWVDMTKIFGLANFPMWCEKRTILYVFERDGREICLQEVDGLGLFMEIESDKYTKCKDDLVRLAESFRLPLGDDFHVKLPYLLYLKSLA